MPRPDSSVSGLAGIQAAFLSLIVGDSDPAPLAAAGFDPPPGDRIETRLGIYRSGYLIRLVEALEADYPSIRRILGAGPFGSMVTRYVAACPPRSFDIGRAGDRLAGFLADDELTVSLPFLPDLARLEWALAEAFVSPDTPPLSWGDLAALDAESVAETVFRLRPGAALVESRWPLMELRALRDRADEEIAMTLDGPEVCVLVHRDGLEVRYRAVAEEDARLLRAALPGLRLAEFAERASSPAEADAVVTRFQAWVNAGLFADLEPS